MERKLSEFLLVLVLSILSTSMLTGCNDSKGGENAKTVFDVNSSKVQITYNDKTTTLTGDKQDEFVNLIKNIYQGSDVKEESATTYNMKIDFDNGNIGEISTDKKVFKFQNDVKNISDKDLTSLMKYVN